jgi:hypothetical protein
MGLVALTGEEGAQQVVTEPPAADTPVPGGNPSTAGTAAPASVPLPETFLAVRDHGTELVMVETATGRVRRTLVDLGDFPENGSEEDKSFWPYIDGLTLSPDGRTVYYSTGPEPAVGNLYRVAADGGEPEQIADGLAPAISPDGRRLAFWSLDAIVVKNLDSGESTRFEPGEGFTYRFGNQLAWAADSRHLAFEKGFVEGASSIHVLDTATPGTLSGARPVGGDYEESDTSPSFRSFDGLLGVVQVCCPGPEGSGHDADTFAVLDPVTGQVKGRLDLPFQAKSAAYDRSGRHQLFVAGDGTVLRRSGGGFTAVLRLGGVTLVAW